MSNTTRAPRPLRAIVSATLPDGSQKTASVTGVAITETAAEAASTTTVAADPNASTSVATDPNATATSAP